MSPPTDADQLPPVQYLILELLAARVRTGEQVWSFPDRLRPQLRKLAEEGLIGWQSSPAPGACHAWFLEPGRTLMLLDAFQTPVTRLEKALEEVHGRLTEARAALERAQEVLKVARAWRQGFPQGDAAGFATEADRPLIRALDEHAADAGEAR